MQKTFWLVSLLGRLAVLGKPNRFSSFHYLISAFEVKLFCILYTKLLLRGRVFSVFPGVLLMAIQALGFPKPASVIGTRRAKQVFDVLLLDLCMRDKLCDICLH